MLVRTDKWSGGNMKLMALMLVGLFCFPVFSQVPVPAPVAAVEVAPVASPSPAPDKIQGAVQSVENAVSKIPSSVPAWLLGILAFLVEICLRFYPTMKPKSLFLSLSIIFKAVGDGLIKISNLLDIIVQKLKDTP